MTLALNATEQHNSKFRRNVWEFGEHARTVYFSELLSVFPEIAYTETNYRLLKGNRVVLLTDRKSRDLEAIKNFVTG